MALTQLRQSQPSLLRDTVSINPIDRLTVRLTYENVACKHRFPRGLPNRALSVRADGSRGAPTRRQQRCCHTCYLEFKTSLSITNWSVATSVAGNGAVQTLTDTGATDRQRFYRVRVQ